MKKTLLICFLHGFKGGESTFGDKYAFTEHLRDLVAGALPKIDIKVVVYPKYETRGDLGECVARFRDWLLDMVIDLEVAAGTPSPMVDPSVRVILVGHSMGGIVAAETAIGLATEKAIHGSTDSEKEESKSKTATRPSTPNSLMFPYIQGVLAFDTPFLGISPGVVAHGAAGHYTTASKVAQLSGLTSLWGGSKAGEANRNPSTRKAPAGALPAPAGHKTTDGEDSWARWGRLAMYAGAASAVVAGGAAAYYNREQISQGLSWATSHLEFVGCLARKEELRRRVATMVRLNSDLGVGFGNLYTRLGDAAGSKTVNMVGSVLGKDRTFCVVPKRDLAGDWRPAVNNKAAEETTAHMTMFEPKENPGYEGLLDDAKKMISKWLQNDWYESSSHDSMGT